MTPTPPRVRHAQRIAQAFAAHWGLDAGALANHLAFQVKQLALPDDAAEKAVEAALMQYAVAFRNRVLSPILKDLFDWLRARLSYRLGAACHAYQDDAVSQTLKALVDHWKPWWTTARGREHLRRYGFVTAMRMTVRAMRGDQAREQRFQGCEPGWVLDPETELLEALERHQRAIAQSKLRDLNWLLEAGLTRAEANAVVRWIGLDERDAALRKAIQRATKRLKTLVGPLVKDRRRHPRSPAPAHCWCTVEHLGLRGRFQVVDYSAGGLGLECLEDGASLEIGAECTVRIHSGSTVIVRGARCVRIERTDRQVRIGMQFDFPHPLPLLQRRQRDAQVTL